MRRRTEEEMRRKGDGRSGRNAEGRKKRKEKEEKDGKEERGNWRWEWGEEDMGKITRRRSKREGKRKKTKIRK